MDTFPSICPTSPPSMRGNWPTRTIGRLAFMTFLFAYGDIIVTPYYIHKYSIVILIQYFILYAVMVVPIFSMELMIGQYQSLGPIQAFKNLAPACGGIGYGMVFNTIIVSMYYNLFLATNLLLLYKYISFVTGYSDTSGIPSVLEEFLEAKNSMSTLKTNDLSFAYFCSWFIVVLCILKRREGSRSFIVISNIIPLYLIFLVCCLKTFVRENEVQYEETNNTTFDFSILSNISIWSEIAQMVVFDTGIAYGTLTTLASYNRTSANCILDSFLLPFIGIFYSLTCFYLTSGNVYEKVIESKKILALLSYSYSSYSTKLSGILYAAFFIKGLACQTLIMETTFTAIFDQFPTWRYRYHFRVLLCFSFLLFLPGWSLIVIPGIYNSAIKASKYLHFTILLLLVISNYFAYRQFDMMKDDMKMNLPKFIGIYLKCCWVFITPATMVVFVVLMFLGDQPNMAGIALAIVGILIIVGTTIYLCRKNENIFKPGKDFTLERNRLERPPRQCNIHCLPPSDNLSLNSLDFNNSF